MKRARALTLIEVVASLVLVATTVTLLLVAHANSLKQLHSTRDQQIAATLARELTTAWEIDPPESVGQLEGSFASYPEWRWTRTTRPSALGLASDLQEVTLTIHRRDKRGAEHVMSRYTWLGKPDDE